MANDKLELEIISISERAMYFNGIVDLYNDILKRMIDLYIEILKEEQK